MKQSADCLTELWGRGGKGKNEQGQGGVGDSNFLCSEYDDRADQVANETYSKEWDHSCNTGNVAADGKYLEEVDTFDTNGIQGRHISEYPEQW